MSESTLQELTDEQLRAAEQDIVAQKREREHAKWDAELVGRHFRIIRAGDADPFSEIARFQNDDYVTLEESLAAGGSRQYVYADVVYLHIQRRDQSRLICSGFEVSSARRDEPYLKIQPVFSSYSDFRDYLGQWSQNTGPVKHFDEISKEEFNTALMKAVGSFCGYEAVGSIN